MIDVYAMMQDIVMTPTTTAVLFKVLKIAVPVAVERERGFHQDEENLKNTKVPAISRFDGNSGCVRS